eukprot:SAG31_NODE_18853_length_620_cov_1.092131_1_plen_149_part_00
MSVDRVPPRCPWARSQMCLLAGAAGMHSRRRTRSRPDLLTMHAMNHGFPCMKDSERGSYSCVHSCTSQCTYYLAKFRYNDILISTYWYLGTRYIHEHVRRRSRSQLQLCVFITRTGTLGLAVLCYRVQVGRQSMILVRHNTKFSTTYR